jgi:hypothetical protein
MIHNTVVHKPARDDTVVDYRTCDICKKRIEEPKTYSVDGITITRRTGSSFPEGGSGETLSFDVCPKCFENEVVLFFKKFGSSGDLIDWDY